MKIKLSAGHKVSKPENQILKKLKENHKNFKLNIEVETIVFQDSKLIIKPTVDGDKVLCFNKEDHEYLYKEVDCFLIDEVLDFEELIKKIFHSSTNNHLRVDLYREYFSILYEDKPDGFLLEKAEWI